SDESRLESGCPHDRSGHVLQAHEVSPWVKLRKEDVSGRGAARSEQADLAGFADGDEIAPGVSWNSERLALGEPRQPALEKASVGKCHVREAGRGNPRFARARENQVFHETLAGAHHARRVDRLVGGHREVAARVSMPGEPVLESRLF